MADNDSKNKRGDVLTPRQSFGDGPSRRRREPQLQAPIQQQAREGEPVAAASSVPGEVLMTWTVNRLGERPLISALVVVILAGLFIWLRAFTASWLMALLFTGLVIVSLAGFLFPTTFTLYENGLAVTNVRREYRSWSRFAVMRVHPDAIQIGPMVAGVKARWNRGTLIYFGNADKAAVERVVRERLGLDKQEENTDE